jgi:hypothetical protein
MNTYLYSQTLSSPNASPTSATTTSTLTSSPQPSPPQQQQQQQQQMTTSTAAPPLILKAPQAKDIIFFNENGFINTANQLLNYFSNGTTTTANVSLASNGTVTYQETPSNTPTLTTPSTTSVVTTTSNILSPAKKLNRVKKKVTFPDDDRIILGFSNPPKTGWMPGVYSTSDLLDAYIRSCDRHKCKPLAKLMPQLKALQDLDCANGEKVNVLNLKSLYPILF